MTAESHFHPEPSAAATKPRRRWLRRMAIGFGSVALIFATPFSIWYFSAKSARDAELAKIRTAGDPVWFAELKPASIDPAKDGMPSLRQAFAAMKPLPDDISEEMWSLYDPEEDSTDPAESAKFMEEHGDIVVEPEGIKLRDWLAQHAAKEPDQPAPRPPLTVREKLLIEKLRPIVAANKPAYELADKAIQLPHLKLDTDFDNPQPLWMVRPEQEQFMDIQELLEAKLRCELFDEDKARVASTLSTVFVLAQRQHSAAQVSLVDVLISSTNSGRGIRLLAEVMEFGALDTTRIVEFDHACSQFEGFLRFRPAILGERAATLTTGDNFLEHGEHEAWFMRSAAGRFVYQPFVWDNETNYLRAVSAMATYADRYDKEAFQARDEVYDREIAPLNDDNLSGFRALSHMAAALLVPQTGLTEAVVVDARNRLLASRAGMCVDAYYHMHGEFPATLEAALGGPLKEVPKDVVKQQPLVLIVDDRAFAVCPATEADRERKLLKQAIEDRRGKSAAAAGQKDDPGNAEQDQQDIARDEEDSEPSRAFRVIYRAAPTLADGLR